MSGFESEHIHLQRVCGAHLIHFTNYHNMNKNHHHHHADKSVPLTVGKSQRTVEMCMESGYICAQAPFLERQDPLEVGRHSLGP